MKVINIEYFKSEPIEKYDCLLGDLTLKVNYEDSYGVASQVLNYSFQFNKDTTSKFAQTTFALTNDSKENYVFDNMGSYSQKNTIALLEKKLKSWVKKNQVICENSKGDVELFTAFLDNSYKMQSVYKRELLFSN